MVQRWLCKVHAAKFRGLPKVANYFTIPKFLEKWCAIQRHAPLVNDYSRCRTTESDGYFCSATFGRPGLSASCLCPRGPTGRPDPAALAEEGRALRDRLETVGSQTAWSHARRREAARAAPSSASEVASVLSCLVAPKRQLRKVISCRSVLSAILIQLCDMLLQVVAVTAGQRQGWQL